MVCVCVIFRVTYCCLWCWRSWLRLEYTLRTQRRSLSVRTSGFLITFSAKASIKAAGQNMRFSNWDRKRIIWTKKTNKNFWVMCGQELSTKGNSYCYDVIAGMKDLERSRMMHEMLRVLLEFFRIQLCVAAPVCCSICLSWRRCSLKWQRTDRHPCSAVLYRTAAL